MPHHIDIDSIHQNVFSILHLCYGSKTFAQSHSIDAMKIEGNIHYEYYFGWLKYILSEKLIEISIKTRIAMDFLSDEDDNIDLYKEDKKISSEYNIGFFIGNDNSVTIRETCNKIIHALSIVPNEEEGEDEHFFDEENSKKREWEYWNGVLELKGYNRGKEWNFTLHVSDFCLAVEDFICFLEGSYDWSHVYKYD
jgi:hypothetical protein